MLKHCPHQPVQQQSFVVAVLASQAAWPRPEHGPIVVVVVGLVVVVDGIVVVVVMDVVVDELVVVEVVGRVVVVEVI